MCFLCTAGELRFGGAQPALLKGPSKRRSRPHVRLVPAGGVAISAPADVACLCVRIRSAVEGAREGASLARSLMSASNLDPTGAPWSDDDTRATSDPGGGGGGGGRADPSHDLPRVTLPAMPAAQLRTILDWCQRWQNVRGMEAAMRLAWRVSILPFARAELSALERATALLQPPLLAQLIEEAMAGEAQPSASVISER